MSRAPLPPPPSTGRRAGARRGGWPAASAVLLSLVITTFGGYLVAGAITEPEGRPVAVGGIVRIRPLSGWAAAGDLTAGGVPGVRITRGSGSLDVFGLPFGGTADELAKVYVDRVLRPSAIRLSVAPSFEHVQLGSTLGATRIRYVAVVRGVAAPIEGEVTVATRNGNGVVFDGWAPEGLLQYVLDDVHAMEDGAQVT